MSILPKKQIEPVGADGMQYASGVQGRQMEHQMVGVPNTSQDGIAKDLSISHRNIDLVN